MIWPPTAGRGSQGTAQETTKTPSVLCLLSPVRTEIFDGRLHLALDLAEMALSLVVSVQIGLGTEGKTAGDAFVLAGGSVECNDFFVLLVCLGLFPHSDSAASSGW